MGIYLNPGDDKFMMAQRSKIYVDKSNIIAYLNSVFRTEDRFVCVSRPRRFGKSMAANMIAAYYDHLSTAQSIFGHMKIVVLCQDLKQIKMRIFQRKTNFCFLGCICAFM